MTNPDKPWKMVSLAYSDVLFRQQATPDPAYSNTIGVSIFVCGDYFMSGIIEDKPNKFNEINHWVNFAYAKAVGLDLPLLCFPAGWGDTERSVKGSVSMGKALGWWEQEIRILSPPRSTLEVDYVPIIPIDWSDWTTRLFGTRKRSVKDKAILLAGDIAKEKITDHNEAEAICINRVASYLETIKVKGLERGKK